MIHPHEGHHATIYASSKEDFEKRYKRFEFDLDFDEIHWQNNAAEITGLDTATGANVCFRIVRNTSRKGFVA